MFIWAARRVISKAHAAGASNDLRMRAAMAFNLLSYVEITNKARVLFIASQSLLVGWVCIWSQSIWQTVTIPPEQSYIN